MLNPRVALASLSGRSDAAWARAAAPYVGAAFLGGIALDEPTRQAARSMQERDREEFLPADQFAFIDDQLGALSDVSLTPGFNVRAVEPAAIRRAAAVCANRDAILEVNAHCRQAEMCAAGAGQILMSEPARLRQQVKTAASAGATVSVKLRTEVSGVDLPDLGQDLESAGANILHIDAMDSEPVVGLVAAATDCFVIANNGVRDRETVAEYLDHGADAVSVGRPSDDPTVLKRVRRAVGSWFESSRPAPEAEQ
ncbi:MAG: tRNA-dihydrouridine synthase [Salinirussus sp.]